MKLFKTPNTWEKKKYDNNFKNERKSPVNNDQLKKQLEELFISTSPVLKKPVDQQPSEGQELRMGFVEQIRKDASEVHISHKRPRSKLRSPADLSIILNNLKQLVKDCGGPDEFCNSTFMQKERLLGLFKGDVILTDDLIAHIELSVERPGALIKGVGFDEEAELLEMTPDLKDSSTGQSTIKPVVLEVVLDEKNNIKRSKIAEGNKVVHRIQQISKPVEVSDTIPVSNSRKGSKKMSQNTIEISKLRSENLEKALAARGLKAKLCKAMGYNDAFLAFLKAGRTQFTDDIKDKVERLCGFPKDYLDMESAPMLNEVAIRERLSKAENLAKIQAIDSKNRKEVTMRIIEALENGESIGVPSSSNAPKNVVKPAQKANKPVTIEIPMGKSEFAMSRLNEEEAVAGANDLFEQEPVVKKEAPVKTVAQEKQQEYVKPSVEGKVKADSKLNSAAPNTMQSLQAAMLRELADQIESGNLSSAQRRKITLALMAVEGIEN